ncbi:MAG: heme-binding protein [Terriglobales bacterium]
MSDETSRPTCPFALTGPYVPPRFQQGPGMTALNLGPLAFLAGCWRGPGFNAIWRPDNPKSLPHEHPPDKTKRFLELNLPNDSFDFQIIPGVVPNRGLNPQTDLKLYGLHYLQRVSDADPHPSKKVEPHGYSTTAGQALHIEPGLFMKVPASKQPDPGDTPIVNEDAIVRMASIPHGVTVLMQGRNPGSKPHPGAPHIPALKPFSSHGNEYPGLSPIPFPGPYVAAPSPAPPLPDELQPAPVPPGPNPPGVGIQPITTTTTVVNGTTILPGAQHVVPEINIALDTLHPKSQSSGPFPASFQGFINDPNSILRDAIEGQDILGHITIHLTTDSLSKDGKPTQGVGSFYETVSNIPFLGVANQTPPNPLPSQPANVATEAAPIPNAFVYSASATFWIEWVRIPDYPILKEDPGPAIKELEPFWPEGTYLQLQYSQLVILIFNNVLWPHVTVGTLTLSAG